MIANYLNQTILLKTKIGNDGYGLVYDVPISVKARWEGKRRLVRNSQGVEVISEARVYIGSEVKPGDILTYKNQDWTVITCAEAVTLNGIVMWYEVAV